MGNIHRSVSHQGKVYGDLLGRFWVAVAVSVPYHYAGATRAAGVPPDPRDVRPAVGGEARDVFVAERGSVEVSGVRAGLAAGVFRRGVVRGDTGSDVGVGDVRRAQHVVHCGDRLGAPESFDQLYATPPSVTDTGMATAGWGIFPGAHECHVLDFASGADGDSADEPMGSRSMGMSGDIGYLHGDMNVVV